MTKLGKPACILKWSNSTTLKLGLWIISQVPRYSIGCSSTSEAAKPSALSNFPSIPQVVFLQCRDSKKGTFRRFCNNVTVLQCYIRKLVKFLQNCYKSDKNAVKTRQAKNRNYFTNGCRLCFLGENSHLSGRKVAVKSEFHAYKVGVSLALKLPNIKH